MGDRAAVAARAVAPILGGLVQAGCDPAPAAAEAGIDPSQLADPDSRVEHDRVVRLWELAGELSGEPDFGLRCAGLLQPGHMGVVEYGFRKSHSIRQGMERIQRYFRINHDVAGFELSDDGGLYEVQHTLPAGRSLPRAAVDFILATPVRIVRESTAERVGPVKVLLDYPEPADTTALSEWFGAELVFSASKRALIYDAADVEAPLLEADAGLSLVLDQHAEHVLSNIPRVHTLSDRVRAFMAEQLCGGNPDAQAVAEHVKMSVRTLHRRLEEDGTSHKALLEELRRELSARFLQEATVSIAEVAFLLGFSEPSAFHRAFKRWTGHTPAQYRKLHG